MSPVSPRRKSDDPPTQESVDLLDKMADDLLNDGQELDSLRYRERGLLLRKDIYGLRSPEVEFATEELTLLCNTLAMKFLCQDRETESLELLKKAELFTESNGLITNKQSRLKLRAVTLNNMGCYYKNRGKLHTALPFLDRALRIEAHVPGCDNPASTHLNLCAILSQLGRHRAAADHASCALQLLQEEISRKDRLQQKKQEPGTEEEGKEKEDGGEGKEGGGDDEGGEEEEEKGGESAQNDVEDGAREDNSGEVVAGAQAVSEAPAEPASLLGSPSAPLLDLEGDAASESSAPAAAADSASASSSGGGSGGNPSSAASLLAIAFYNLAVEQEYLKAGNKAIVSYRRAADAAEAELGADHPMTQGMKRSLESAVASRNGRGRSKQHDKRNIKRSNYRASPHSPRSPRALASDR